MSVMEWGAREQRALAAASNKLISCVENSEPACTQRCAIVNDDFA